MSKSPDRLSQLLLSSISVLVMLSASACSDANDANDANDEGADIDERRN